MGSGLVYYRDDAKNTPHDMNGNPIGGGPWLRADDVDASMRWCTAENNNKLAIVTQEADCPPGKAARFVAPATTLTRRTVEELKFQGAPGLWVPHSNGRNPHDDYVNRFLDETRALRDVKMGHLAHYRKATDAKFFVAGSLIKTIPKISETKFLGAYNVSPTGIVGCVDIEGHQYIAPASAVDAAALEAHGYHRELELPIPFARGEIPVLQPNPKTHDLEYAVAQWQKAPSYFQGMIGAASGVPAR